MALKTADDYLNSLRKLDLRVYLLGEKVADPVDHPIIRPSVNSVAKTYELALNEETQRPDDRDLEFDQRKSQSILPSSPKH